MDPIADDYDDTRQGRRGLGNSGGERGGGRDVQQADAARSSQRYREKPRQRLKGELNKKENLEDFFVEEELANPFTTASNNSLRDINQITEQVHRCSEVDLCFLMDVTGNMEPYIAEVGSCIKKLIDCFIPATKPDLEHEPEVRNIRFAFVGCRDFDNILPFEVLNFTENADQFMEFCQRVKATGGTDEPEDVFGGIEKALTVNWREQGDSRLIFHLADAPCHGKEFHSGLDDSFSGGIQKVVKSKIFSTECVRN
jgi:hypothetical protein